METIVIKHGNRIKKVVCKECGCEFLININSASEYEVEYYNKDKRIKGTSLEYMCDENRRYNFYRDHDVQYSIFCPECMVHFHVHRKDLKNVED